MIKKSLLIWLMIIPAAILNGGIREKILAPLLGSYALPVSGITLCLIIFLISLIFMPKIGKGSKKTYARIGLLWLILTVLFETALGLVLGQTIPEIMKAYDVTTGNLWLLVVLFIGFVPLLTSKTKKT